MGGFSDKPAKNWNSTKEYRNLFQSQIEPTMQRSMDAINQSYAGQQGILSGIQQQSGDLSKMLANQAQTRMGLMGQQAGVVPGAMSGAYTQTLAGMAPAMMDQQMQLGQMQSNLELQKLAQTLGVNEQGLQAYLALMNASGGGRGAKQGWGSKLTAGLGMAAQFLPGVGGAMGKLFNSGAMPSPEAAAGGA